MYVIELVLLNVYMNKLLNVYNMNKSYKKLGSLSSFIFINIALAMSFLTLFYLSVVRIKIS